MEHTVRSFSQDLEELTGDLARMGGLAEDMLSDAIQAIATRDLALAETVVARDPQVDNLEVEVEKKILRLLALRQPLARPRCHPAWNRQGRRQGGEQAEPGVCRHP